MSSNKKKKFIILALFVSILAAGFLTYGLRAYRAADTAWNTREQIKMLIQTGGTIGEAPASDTFSTGYLQAIFGDNPQLLSELRSVIQSGLSETPALSLGEVSAMMVTYHQNDGDEVRDVVAHVIGGFSLDQREPSMNRDGFFHNMVDEPVWQAGNSVISMLGRDMALFAREDDFEKQHNLLESMMSGDILPLVDTLEEPLHYTLVMPDPRRLIPRRLAPHIQAIVMKGYLSREGGSNSIILLTPSDKSANYALLLLSDLKRAAEITLKTKFQGVVRQKPWGPQISPWWAYEMVQNSEDSVVEKEGNIIRIRSDYERVMLNALLKTIERAGRDLALLNMVYAEKMDPLEVDRRMASRKPSHYWSDPHRWGPNWPIPPTDEEVAEYRESLNTPQSSGEPEAPEATTPGENSEPSA